MFSNIFNKISRSDFDQLKSKKEKIPLTFLPQPVKKNSRF